MKSPVLLLVYNRPETTAKVFRAIQQACPERLFINADGPRNGKEKEIEKIQEVRNIVSKVDWPCEVKTRFLDENLGCRKGVSSAIDWFFSEVEEGIILEDDTLPSASFFHYAETLLEKYRESEQVMHISGSSPQFGHWRGDGTYYASNYSHVWGWASWRRAWKHYQVDMRDYPKFKHEEKINSIWPTTFEQVWWSNFLDKFYLNMTDTWDYQWTWSIWNAGGCSITPNVNLIENIGFGSDATHTKNIENPYVNYKAAEIEKIIHPISLNVNLEADRFTSNINYGYYPSILNQIKFNISRSLPPFIKNIKKKMS